jgi:hypothetical protein
LGDGSMDLSTGSHKSLQVKRLNLKEATRLLNEQLKLERTFRYIKIKIAINAVQI